MSRAEKIEANVLEILSRGGVDEAKVYLTNMEAMLVQSQAAYDRESNKDYYDNTEIRRTACEIEGTETRIRITQEWLEAQLAD